MDNLTFAFTGVILQALMLVVAIMTYGIGVAALVLKVQSKEKPRSSEDEPRHP